MDRRNAITLGAAAGLGGLLPARPDQQYDPPRGGQQIPGARGNITARQVIVIGSGGSGVFVYSPTKAFGNLIASMAAASGTDPLGNAYVAGVASYTGANQAASLTGGELILWTAPGAAGPWTIKGALQFVANALLLQAAGGSGAPVNIAADTGKLINFLTAANALLGLTVAGGLTTDTEVVSTAAATGIVLAVTNTVTGSGTLIVATVAGASQRWFGGQVPGDTNNRITLATDASSNPQLGFGSGAASPDAFIKRTVANRVDVVGADLDIATLGRGLQINEGANARMGVATLVAGGVVVNNTTVTANTRIFVNAQNTGGTVGAIRVSARTPGVSFTIASNNGADTSTVAWLMIEPG